MVPHRSVSARGLVLILMLILGLPARGAEKDDWLRYQQLLRARQYAEAVALIEPLASRGDARANYELAQFYRSGQGVSKSPERSRRHLMLSAQAGYADAQYLLGLYCLQGTGGAMDVGEARQWLEHAARQGHARAGQQLADLSVTPGPLDTGSDRDLFAAVSRGDVSRVQAALAQGKGRTLRDSDGNSLLGIALGAGQVPMAQLLLEAGVDVAGTNHLGESAVHLALEKDDPGLLALLKKYGVDLNSPNRLGKSPLHLAVEKNHPQQLAWLLANGADIRHRDQKGETALDKARIRQNPSLLAIFSKAGLASGDETLQQQRRHLASEVAGDVSALQLAVERDDLALLQSLLPEASQPWAANVRGQTLITLAAEYKRSRILSFLLGASGGAGLVAADGRNALFHAVASRCDDCVSLLLKAGVDPLQPDAQGLTPLEQALVSGSPLAPVLLAAVDRHHWQSRWLLLAVKAGQGPSIKTLLAQVGDVDVRDSQQRTPLWLAAASDQAGVVQSLLQKGANPNLSDLEGNTPLHSAAAKGAKAALTLLSPVSTLNEPNKQGSTPLMLAADAHCAPCVQVLLKAGVAVDARDNRGNTALMGAVLGGDLASVDALLAGGAKLNIRNNNKQDAMAMAKQLKHTDIVTRLEQAAEEQGLMGLFH